MIEGLSHLTFVVADLERSTRLVVEVLGGRQVHDSGPAPPGRSRDRFFVAGGLWIALLEGTRPAQRSPAQRSPAERSYDHVAFKVAPEALAPARAALTRLGLAVEEGRPRAPGEARSLYFHDWEGHLFELHTGTLDDRLAAEAERRR